jgi:hypothetical protein
MREVIRIEDKNAIRTGVFSNKGNYLAIGSNSKLLRIFNLIKLMQENSD